MSWMNVVSLLGGLSLFLFGMKVMGEGLEKAAGSRLKRLLEMVTHNRVLAMLAGLVITAVIQSSSATTVMVVGFVNAGLLSLTQAVGVIMGANIGTTVTSLMLSVKLDFGALFACIGLVLSVAPKKMPALRQAGIVLTGLGVLFVGMDFMSAAMSPLRDWQLFRDAMTHIDNPVLGILVGALVTAVLQSSSASVGILQALAGEGLIPLRGAMFILFGQNIGTCVTALIACAGANATAKRAAVVHLLFNVIGALMFTVLVCVLPIADWMVAFAPDNLRLQIAMTHVMFNVVTTMLLLPAASVLEKIACLLVHDRNEGRTELRLEYFDRRLLATPPIAVAQLFKETQRMGDLARTTFTGAVSCFHDWDGERAAELRQQEDALDFLNERITSALVDVRALDLDDEDAHLAGRLFHIVNDFERVGDHSMNVLDAAEMKEQEGVKFTAKVMDELESLAGTVSAQLDDALAIFRMQNDDEMRLAKVEAVEEEIDRTTEALRQHHVERLKNKKCSAKNGMLYLEMLTNLERVGDHAENIATGGSLPQPNA